jgi:subtilase family serine protease
VQSIERMAVITAAVAALAACAANTGGGPLPSAGSGASRATQLALPANVVRACPATDPSVMHCLALIRTDTGGTPKFSGYSPADLQNAYALPSAKKGKGQVVAVVDAFDDPNAEADLAAYRSNFGLPPCTSSDSCFRKVNQLGRTGHFPSPDPGWATEEALDTQIVSAVCPKCSIVLVEANTPSASNLAKSVDTAVALGANVVSNSYYGYGDKGMQYAAYYDHPGTIVTASAGDEGYGIAEPAGYPTVVAVGGTKLTVAHNKRGWKEIAWTGTGSGCEARLSKPSWQTDAGCKGRTMNDVAAIADPARGVAIYDTYYAKGWIEVGGTSVGAPLIAGVYALAGNAASLDAAQSLYAPGASLWDVTSGSNGTCVRKYLCNARTGYDGPTGNGTPNGISAF